MPMIAGVSLSAEALAAAQAAMTGRFFETGLISVLTNHGVLHWDAEAVAAALLAEAARDGVARRTLEDDRAWERIA